MELDLLTRPDAPGINQTACHVRALRYSLPSLPCDRCGHPAARFSTVARTAIDLDLDQPTLLLVIVSIHHCQPCHHYFRAQPPFLRADAIYTNRVVTKAVQAVYQDGMAKAAPQRAWPAISGSVPVKGASAAGAAAMASV